MINCSIPCRIPEKHLQEVVHSIKEFSDAVACYGFAAEISQSTDGKTTESSITLMVDDEFIKAMKGAKRGPKEKATNITIDEMLALKGEGRPPREIAALAGIGVATYFRRMAAYKAQTDSQDHPQEAGR